MHVHRRDMLRLAGALVAGGLLGLGLRLLFFLLAVLLLRAAAGLGLQLVRSQAWVDPVYSRAALHTLADLRLRGLAVGGPTGDALHAFLPALFVDSAAAHGAPARIVVAPGRAVLGRLVAAALAHVVVLAVGLWLVRSGWLRQRAEWIVLGLATQAQVAAGVVAAPPSLAELEATGVSFAANALLPWLAPKSAALSDGLSSLSGPLASAALVGLALLTAYLAAAALVSVVAPTERSWRLSGKSRRLARRAGRPASAHVLSLMGALLLTLLSACASAWTPQAQPVAPALAAGLTPASPASSEPRPVAEARVSAAAPPPVTAAHAVLGLSDRWFGEPLAGPSRVEIVGADLHYQYLVNGRPEVIRGMGLNTQYASELSPEDRRDRLDADFTALRALGVNTVLGWDPQEFDETLFERAQAHGLGVIPPFDLDPTTDYTDPAVRAQLSEAVMRWVARFRAQPGLRMWGLGNEVLHKIVHPAWVGPQDPAAARNARAFADWLVATADAIHAADPDHPVTYRSAEDAFVPWVVDALHRRGGEPRPWFVWGTNCYQDYLSTLVDEWPDQGMDGPLWVSEFAPGGMAVPDRPDGFQTMWGYVRRHPDWVLGGAVYAWTRNGPEGVDRTFGLTDDGTPVDGRSLDRLGELFHEPD